MGSVSNGVLEISNCFVVNYAFNEDSVVWILSIDLSLE